MKSTTTKASDSSGAFSFGATMTTFDTGTLDDMSVSDVISVDLKNMKTIPLFVRILFRFTL